MPMKTARITSSLIPASRHGRPTDLRPIATHPQSSPQIHGARSLLTIHRDSIIKDDGQPDPIIQDAQEVPLDRVPMPISSICSAAAIARPTSLARSPGISSGRRRPGWRRVQAICDFVNTHVTFGYEYARPTRTAYETFEEKVGVCRDFAHLAVAFCRCMNIPTRYANGFLGDIGVPADPAPMDYNAWFEVFLDGRWFTFDARHNQPRIGRITVARGRDATDIPLASSFGAASARPVQSVDGGSRSGNARRTRAPQRLSEMILTVVREKRAADGRRGSCALSSAHDLTGKRLASRNQACEDNLTATAVARMRWRFTRNRRPCRRCRRSDSSRR